MTKTDWTQNKFWQERKNNGQFKIEFYLLSNRGNKKIHSIFERPSIEACQLLVDEMGKNWGNVIEGNNNKGWNVYSQDFSVVAGDMYHF